MRMGRHVLLVIGGFAAGVAFVVACGSSGRTMGFGPSRAAAQTACAQYEVQSLSSSVTSSDVSQLPAGWIPFAIAPSSSHVVAFRCVQ
jgi:hypothetical protein